MDILSLYILLCEQCVWIKCFFVSIKVKRNIWTIDVNVNNLKQEIILCLLLNFGV